MPNVSAAAMVGTTRSRRWIGAPCPEPHGHQPPEAPPAPEAAVRPCHEAGMVGVALPVIEAVGEEIAAAQVLGGLAVATGAAHLQHPLPPAAAVAWPQRGLSAMSRSAAALRRVTASPSHAVAWASTKRAARAKAASHATRNSSPRRRLGCCSDTRRARSSASPSSTVR